MQYHRRQQQASSEGAGELERQKFSLGSTARSPQGGFMKRNLIGTLSLVVLSLCSVTGAFAQTITKGDVPFSFIAAGKELPAGQYAVSANGLSSIYITNLETGKSIMSLVRSDAPNTGGSKLVFHHYGNQYFLAEAWGAEGRAGMVAPASKLEKELMASGSKPNLGQVVIALK
jgi:hypothetical protein